jgi:hypothetical protein
VPSACAVNRQPSTVNRPNAMIATETREALRDLDKRLTELRGYL